MSIHSGRSKVRTCYKDIYKISIKITEVGAKFVQKCQRNGATSLHDVCWPSIMGSEYGFLETLKLFCRDFSHVF